MSLLLRRYAGHRSALTLSRSSSKQSSITRLFMSARKPILPPLDAKSDEPEERADVITNEKPEVHYKPSSKPKSENDPIADFDVPALIRSHATNGHIVLKSAALLPDPSAPEFEEILREKLKIIATECDYSVPTKDQVAKEVHNLTLRELLEYVPENWSDIPANLQDELLDGMESSGVFRDLKEVEAKFLFSDDTVVFNEPEWPKISLQYQIMEAVIELDPQNSRFNVDYVKKVISRFRAPDVNERTELGRFVILLKDKRSDLKDAILKKCLDGLIDYLDGAKSPHTLMPSLSVIYNIFQDTPPTDQEPNNVELYNTYILPIFGALHYTTCHTQMSQLVQLFTKGAPKLCVLPTVKVLLKHFPWTKSSKTVSVLGILTSCITKISRNDFKELMKEIFTVYAKCTAGCQVKVSEASTSIWKKIELEPIIMEYAKVIFPMVYSILGPASRDSWSPEITAAIDEVFYALNRIDTFVFQDLCRGKTQGNIPNDDVKRWATVARQAAKMDRQVNLAAKLAEIQKVFTVTSQPIQGRPASNRASNANPQSGGNPTPMGGMKRYGK